MQVNVYILGKTFLLLARELCINAPAIGKNKSTSLNLLSLEQQKGLKSLNLLSRATEGIKVFKPSL